MEISRSTSLSGGRTRLSSSSTGQLAPQDLGDEADELADRDVRAGAELDRPADRRVGAPAAAMKPATVSPT